MRVTGCAESLVEAASVGWLSDLGYGVLFGPDIAADELAAERRVPALRDVLLETQLRSAATVPVPCQHQGRGVHLRTLE
jgi:hypothetical protein